MRKIASVLFAVFMLGVTLPALASPFSDLPADHWATQAVKVLAEKGLVEGYPDGTFKGDRAATRYEVAMVVARLVAYLEKQKPQVTKEDLDAIRQLVDEYKDELDAMGVRLKNVEDTLAALEGRVKKLEAIQWKGGFESRFATLGLSPTRNDVPLTPFQLNGPMGGETFMFPTPSGDRNALWDHTNVHRDWNQNNPWTYDVILSGIPIMSGTALTEEGYLQTTAKLSDDYTGGGTISMYNNQGSRGVGYLYGVTPPTLDNPEYNSNGTAPGSIVGNINANLNQIFVQNKNGSATAIVGDWRPAYIPDFMLQGVPNSGMYGPFFLPFHGGQLYGTLTPGAGTFAKGITAVNYEVAAGKLPSGPSLDNGQTSNTWQNEVFGGALGFNYDNPSFSTNFTGSFVRLDNDSASQPAGTGASLGTGVDNPGGWFVVNPVTGAKVGIGPQQETLFGGNADLHFKGNFSWLSIWGKYGNSQYNGNHANSLYTNVGGNLYNAGFMIAPQGGKVVGGADYLSIDPSYDPFISEVNIPTSAFSPTQLLLYMEFPYPVTYSMPFTGFSSMFGINTTAATHAADAFYQAHDSRKYPSNRKGYEAYIDWNYGRGDIGGKYMNLTQVVPSTPGNEFQPGFYESTFFAQPGLPNPPAGHVENWFVYGSYTTPSKDISLFFYYTKSSITRATNDGNFIDLKPGLWFGNVTYSPAKDWSILGGFYECFHAGAGNFLMAPMNPGVILFHENGPYVSVDYHFSKQADAWIMFNQFNMHDDTNGVSAMMLGLTPQPVSNYTVDMVSSGLRILF